MARGRMISKCLSTSERYASLEQHAGKLAEFCQALFPLLVAHADDYGRQAGDEFTIKHLVHPTSKRTLRNFSQALQALHDSSLILWYQVNGSKYLQIQQFEEHQSGLHKRSVSKIPESPGISGKFQEIPSELNRTEGKGTEQKGKEHTSAGADDAKVTRDESDFETFRKAYPASRRVGGPLARSAFSGARKVCDLNTMLGALAQHKESEQWQTPKLIPLMTTWLKQERWLQTLPRPQAFGTTPQTMGNADALRRFAEGGRR